MSTGRRSELRSAASTLAVTLVSLLLLAFAWMPTHPSRDHEALSAELRVARDPTPENKRALQAALDLANRPFHTIQISALICGIALPIWFFPRHRKLSRARTN